MGDLRAVRWTRYGKDRLYVMQPDGIQVGWVDLATGERHLVADALRRDFEVALAAYGDVPAQLTPARAEEPAMPAARTGDEGWIDLAANAPGAAARARAREELETMRDRSRVGAWVARALDLKTEERAWRVGAGGEETVGARLDKLGKHGWHVLHAVPVGSRGSDIDHVLIGPGGVFTVNTKRHPGKKVWIGGDTVMVSGQRVPYVRAARYEAARAAALLGAASGLAVAVTPVLVILTGTVVPDVTVATAPDGVRVLDRSDVPGAFRRCSATLDADTVAELYAVARRSTTWAG